MTASVTVMEDLPLVGRAMRRPSHRFQVEHKPWQVQPFMLAPVLPGDTLKTALLQSRAVTDPIKNPLIGWHLEHYLFYVKLTDLDDGELFKELMLSATASLASATFYNSAAAVSRYKAAVAGYDYVGACLKVVVENYFRDEGETLTYASNAFSGTGTLDGVPLAHVGYEGFMESLMLDGTEDTPDPTEGPVPGESIEATDPYYEMYQRMRMMRLTERTYEDWLKEQGIRGVEVEVVGKPELLPFSRTWQLPSNTVDGATSAVASAVSWSVAERADKDRFFKEPGFVFGVTCARPKVYLGKQTGFAAQMMNDAFAWLPAALRACPELALKKFADTAGPLGYAVGTSKSYWLDVRDLLVYGDQFVNVALTETDNGIVSLPSVTTYDRFYVSETDIDNLFTSASADKVRQDGVVSLQVLGSVVDVT